MKHKFLLGALFFSTLAAAQSPSICDPDIRLHSDGKVSKRLNELLREKKFDAVQDELSDRLRRYEHGELSDIHLYTDIRSAVTGNAALEPLLAQWASEKPSSYFAHLVKGMHHITVGFAKRGGSIADKTSVEQFSAMEAEFKKALDELDAARRIRPTSALTYAAIMEVGKTSAGPGPVKSLLGEAEKMDPKNMAARYQAIHSLNPKWGGTVEDLDGIVSQARAAGLSPARVRYLQYEVEMEKGGFVDFFAKEKVKAIAHYRLAAALCPGSDPWSAIVKAAYVLEDWQTVKEAEDQVLALHPASAKDLQSRGWAFEKLGKMEDAMKDYSAAADRGEGWSQNKLGYLYMTGTVVPKDLRRAKALLEPAAAKGVASAPANLEWVNKQLGIK
jgi:tetratricopeptide (TPR) repeat protein